MTSHTTALVTGATSGLGFEAAAQLAADGTATVIVTGRTPERAEAARRRLVDRTGQDVFVGVSLDLNDAGSVRALVDELADAGRPIDLLLLNAGMVGGNERVLTEEGVEATFAASLIGHHRLTMGLLSRGLLAERGRIVIAGSEAARGDIPTFKPTNLHELAAERYDGDLLVAAADIVRGEGVRYRPATAYANAKLFVAWWAAELSRRLPEGMAVNAVSPGSAPDTNAARNANFFTKYLLIPAFKYLPGQSQSVETAAARYLDVADRSDVTGEFFASAPKKFTGPIQVMDFPRLRDAEARQAGWAATVEVAGIDFPSWSGEASTDAQPMRS